MIVTKSSYRLLSHLSNVCLTIIKQIQLLVTHTWYFLGGVDELHVIHVHILLELGIGLLGQVLDFLPLLPQLMVPHAALTEAQHICGRVIVFSVITAAVHSISFASFWLLLPHMLTLSPFCLYYQTTKVNWGNTNITLAVCSGVLGSNPPQNKGLVWLP